MLLPYKLDYQDTSYWCGPASTRAVLLTRGIDVSEPVLAKAENTTTDGTMRYEIVEELTIRLGVTYKDQAIGGNAATKAEADLMRQRITATVAAGFGTIVNVVGTAYDTAGARHSYTGHYIAVVGADDQGATIMDPAIGKDYRMTWSALADWAAQRGYLYIPNPPASTEEDHMLTLVAGEEAGTKTLWLCDGIVARRVSEDNVKHYKFMHAQGAIKLWNGGEVWEGGKPSWSPEIWGWPVDAAIDVKVDVDADAVVDVLAARLAE